MDTHACVCQCTSYVRWGRTSTRLYGAAGGDDRAALVRARLGLTQRLARAAATFAGGTGRCQDALALWCCDRLDNDRGHFHRLRTRRSVFLRGKRSSPGQQQHRDRRTESPAQVSVSHSRMPPAVPP